jgi:hypothetical protein
MVLVTVLVNGTPRLTPDTCCWPDLIAQSLDTVLARRTLEVVVDVFFSSFL